MSVGTDLGFQRGDGGERVQLAVAFTTISDNWDSRAKLDPLPKLCIFFVKITIWPIFT